MSIKEDKKKAKQHYRGKGGFAPIDFTEKEIISSNKKMDINNYLKNNLVGAVG